MDKRPYPRSNPMPSWRSARPSRRSAVLVALLLSLPATGQSQQEAGSRGEYPRAEHESARGAELRVGHSKDGRELVVEVRNLSLPAGASHNEGSPPLLRGVVPTAGWVHGFRVELVDAAGRELPGELLHHVNLIASGKRELFSNIMQRIAAAGKETGPIKLPRFLGYRLEEGDTLLVAGMLHNPTARGYGKVTLRLRLAFTPAGSWFRPLAVEPFYLDVMPPASGHAYDLPPGRSRRSWEGSPAVASRILGIGGHLHRYAVALRLEDITAGKVLWEAEPHLDDEGEVVGMPSHWLLWRLGVPLRPGHTYRVTAIYENPTGRTIPLGGMGAVGGIVRRTGEHWPALDRQDPEYELDTRLLTEGAYGGHAFGHAHH